MKLLFLDTETTGLDLIKNGIVQISGIIDIDGEVKEEFDFKCRPFQGKFVTNEALNVIKKTKDEVLALPDPTVTYKQLLSVMEKYIDRYNKTDKFYLVGQNVKFDYDMMTQWFKDNGNSYFYAYVAYHLIDIITITALFNLAGIIKTQNMKLATIAEHYGIKFEAHNSMEDIRVTRQIFYKYLRHIEIKK